VTNELKLHIGCGKRVLPGWTHIDTVLYPHIDFVTEAHNLKKIKDNSCTMIYASHVLEYYDWQEAETLVLPEWRRVLCPGGTLRVAVPDFLAICKLYLAGMKLDWFIGPLYGRMLSNEIIYHKCAYDELKLKEILKRVGFKNVHRYDWREVEHVDDHSQAYIPHMEKDKGVLISLNMECYK